MQDLVGEAAHFVRVLGRVQDRFGEQRERTDRGLQLVADVGDEVPAGRLQPHGLRFVGGVDDGEAVPERPDFAEHRGGRPTRSGGALQRGEVDLDRLAGFQRLFGGLAGAGVGPLLVDDAEFSGPGVVQHHVPEPVQQHYTVGAGVHISL
ncbi:hypothetical protein [Saccharopolyspora rectivirgula]|uniref:hypothetical protein n=1 Tax=Saccharopolyspora rectivirgula TaxID=28042 RepID=UPI0034D24694